MSVNYHAIGAWVTARGGAWMHAAHHHRSIDVCAFVLGAGVEHEETVLAFDRSISRRGPDDFFALKTSLERDYDQRTLGELLAFPRFSQFDAKLFLDCAPALRTRFIHDLVAREKPARTATVGVAVGVSTKTAARHLEDLALLGLVERTKQSDAVNSPDLWCARAWLREFYPPQTPSADEKSPPEEKEKVRR